MITIVGRSPLHTTLLVPSSSNLIVAYDLSLHQHLNTSSTPSQYRGPLPRVPYDVGYRSRGGGQERQLNISRAVFNRKGNRLRSSTSTWVLVSGEIKRPQHETRSYEYETSTTICLRKTSGSTARVICRPATPGLCGMPPARPTSNGAR